MLEWIHAHEQMIYIVVLMVFLGIEVIGRVPSVLHTPLMSGVPGCTGQEKRMAQFGEAIAGVGAKHAEGAFSEWIGGEGVHKIRQTSL